MRTTIVFLTATVLIGGFVAPFHLRAQQAGPEYLELLGIAQRALREKKLRNVVTSGSVQPANRVSSIWAKHRFYRKGETWVVDFTSRESAIMRKSNAPEDQVLAKRRPSAFIFSVIGVEPNNKMARVEVRQKLEKDDVPVDPRIDHLVLHINEIFVVVKQETHFRDGAPAHTVESSSLSNVSTGFSAYPVDLPNINLDEGTTIAELPEELRGEVDPKQALEFRSTDLYGRSLSMIWREGDVWPVYVKSPTGIAVLRTERRD
ncbi:MAG: hypothetical protein AB1540_01205 [Bdellovibrionota bacterium]